MFLEEVGWHMLVEELRKIIPDRERVTVNETVLEQHSRDITSYHRSRLPDVVVFPTTTQEVSAVLRYAHAHDIAVTAFGVGSSVEGQVVPLQGGISLDLTLMNQVLDVRPGDFLVNVQPGVRRTELNSHLKKYGLFFPVDPGADATLGGMAATNASGTTAVRYGTMRSQVLGLEVVLADGTIVRTGGMAAKSSSGYHLTGLFVGSEGTLGVITELTLRLYGIPEYILSARAVFADVATASQAAISMRMCGLPLDRIELVDEATIQVVNAFKGTDFVPAPTLFLEVSGSKLVAEKNMELAESILREEGCLDFKQETDSKARAELWTARHEAALAFVASIPGKKKMSTDVCVPLSALPAAIVNAREAIDRHGMRGAILGHVGDGNYHAMLAIDPADRDDMERAARVNHEIVAFALEHGGTCSGEHGIGLGKAKYLTLEHGAAAVDLMRALKRTADPKGILNPGKIFGE